MRFWYIVVAIAVGVVTAGMGKPVSSRGEIASRATGTSAATNGSVTVEFSARSTQVVRTDSGFMKRYIGDVVMRVNPDVWLSANQAVFDGIRREAKLSGDVVAVDSGKVLRADRVDYLFEDHSEVDGQPVARLRQNVSIEDSTRRITAFGADYWTEDDSVVAFGIVRASLPGGTLDTDRLLYSANTGNMSAFGKVKLYDSTQGITIRSEQYQWNQRDSVAFVTGRPLLTKGEGDTMVFVEANFMRYDQRSDHAVAWDSVRIDRGGLSAVCDSVVYDNRDEQLTLYGSPQAIQRTSGDTTTTISETTGDRIVLQLDGADVREIQIYGTRTNAARAIATEFDRARTKAGERWITGNEIVFHVQDDRVERLEIFGQARSRNAPAPSARASEGTNEASGDTMVITFDDNRIRKVFLRGGVEGLFRPPADSSAVDTTGVPEVVLPEEAIIEATAGDDD